MKKIVTAMAATTLLVLAGCGSGSDESEASEIAAPSTTEAVEVVEHQIVVGEMFTMDSPHYVAHVTVTDVFRPESCGEVPYSDGLEYDTFVGIEMDVEVESGTGEGSVPNGVHERTEDGYLQKNRSLGAVACEGYEELSATRVQTGEKHRGVLWLQEDVEPSSEIILEPHVSAHEPVVTEVYVLDLSEFDLRGEPSEVTPEHAPEPAAAASADPVSPLATPTFVRCYDAGGTALLSDGTTTHMDSCHEFAGGPPRLADGRSIYDAFPEQFENLTPDQAASDRAWSDCIEAGNTSEYCSANHPY